MTPSFKATRLDLPIKNEILTSSEDWRNQLEFQRSLDQDFTEFLDLNCTWIKTALRIATHGLGSNAKLEHLKRFFF